MLMTKAPMPPATPAPDAAPLDPMPILKGIGSLRRLIGTYPDGHPMVVQRLRELEDAVCLHLRHGSPVRIDVVHGDVHLNGVSFSVDAQASGQVVQDLLALGVQSIHISEGVDAAELQARADALIAELALPADQVKRVLVDASGYWVFIPPLKSRAEAEKAGKALKEFGVTDYSVVLDQNQRRHAISLGLFRTDESAQAFLKSLQKKGVTDAVAEKRDNFLKEVVFLIREPSEATVAKLAAMRATLPASEVRAVPCPSG